MEGNKADRDHILGLIQLEVGVIRKQLNSGLPSAKLVVILELNIMEAEGDGIQNQDEVALAVRSWKDLE